MHSSRHTLVLILTSLFAAPLAIAETSAQFDSGETRVPLVELYTSEGCSSCPPAERWLNSLGENDDLWKRFVPVAFHVDYWDYIGWGDSFAQAKFSRRQRQYIDQDAARAVYTPGVFSGGEEWLAWRRTDLPQRPTDKPGNLSVNVEGRTAAVFFSANEEHARIVGNIAVLGSGFETRIGAGENKGRTLAHDFVVLHLIASTMEKTAAGFKAVFELPEEIRGRPALAVWVSVDDALAPLQATGGYLE